jgi:hypothetical protein
LLPGADEADGKVVRFTVAPRLTEHVRHRSKYLDMPITDAHAFVFGEGPRARPHARTMKEFMSLLEPGSDGVARTLAGDFSHGSITSFGMALWPRACRHRGPGENGESARAAARDQPGHPRSIRAVSRPS